MWQEIFQARTSKDTVHNGQKHYIYVTSVTNILPIGWNSIVCIDWSNGYHDTNWIVMYNCIHPMKNFQANKHEKKCNAAHTGQKYYKFHKSSNSR